MATADSHESGNIEQKLPSLEIKIPPPLTIHTAPTSPVRLSPIHMNLAMSKTPGSVSPARLQLPIAFRAQTEGLDKDKDEFESLFSDRIQSDPGDFEEILSQQQLKQKKQGYLDVKRKTSLKSLQNLIDDIKKASGNRSYSATKISKAQKEVSTTPKKGKKDVGKDSRKRPLSSNERKSDSRSRSREEKGHGGEKKVIKTVVKDLELDFDYGEKSNMEGEGPDNLFEESSEREVHSCKNSRETGPIRYSKMSEEDAALMFEIRRKELLNFLKKLGANATLIKKKQSYRKPGIPKQGGSVSGQIISELRKSEIEREYRMRAVKETLKESLSPTTFIIYNNNITEQPIWNGPSAAKVRTPLRESSRKQTASLKNVNESVSDAKRRNSVKSYREKDESNQMVSRNLEASFNRIAQDLIEASDKKPARRSNKANERLVGSVEEKREVYESIKIDLKKELLKKKKKKKAATPPEKVEKVEEKVEKVAPKKQAEEAKTQELQQKNAILQAQVQEMQEKTKVNQQLIEDMRKKNQEVLGDIEDIDMQIQRMEAESKAKQNKNRNNKGRVVQNNNQKPVSVPVPVPVVKKKEELPPPPPQEVYEESLEGSYAYTAKMRRSKSRPRSVNMAGSFYSEGLKQQENSQKDVGSSVARTWKEKNPATAVTNRSRRWDEVETKERQGRETNQKFFGDKQVQQQKTNNNPHQKVDEQQQQQSKNVQNNSTTNAKWINPKEEKSINRDTRTAITNEPISNNSNSMMKGKRHNVNTNMKSLDLGRGKVEAPKIDNFKSPKEMREYLSPTNSKLNEKDLRKNNSQTPTLQSTQYPSLTNTTSPVSELFPQSKSVVLNDNAKNKKQSVESIIENSRQKMKKEPNSASAVMKIQTRKGSEIETRSEKSELMKRNERYSAANIHEHPRSPPKISFFDEVKKILKEGGAAKDERKTPNSLPDKNKPLQKSETTKIKKEPMNKPKFDFAPSLEIRSKIYRDSRPLDEMTKSVKVPGLNKKREELLISPKDFISMDQRDNQSQSTTPISLELQNVTNNHKYESVTERPGIGASKSLEKGIRNRIKNLESENLKDQYKSLNKDIKKKKI